MDGDHNCDQLFFSFVFLFPASAAYKTNVENIMWQLGRCVGTQEEEEEEEEEKKPSKRQEVSEEEEEEEEV